MVPPDDLESFLNEYFGSHSYDEEQGGVYHPSARLVARLGLALEPWPGLGAWVEQEKLDALFLHRPWNLAEDLGDIGVLAYHLPFDERLTTGYNPRLAEVLGMRDLAVMGRKAGRPLGMLGVVRRQAFSEFACLLEQTFDGLDALRTGAQVEVNAVAVVSAMTDSLVREAAMRGAQVYVTGQWRHPVTRAVEDTGINVIVLGHRRSEEWGLRALAGVLRERWTDIECVLPPRGH